MAFVDQAALLADPTFRSRVRIALATAARDVMGEAVGSYSTDEFGKRQALAHQVILAAASGDLLEAFALLTAANVAITDQSSDSDIQFTVNSLVDDVAGVRITD